MPDTVIEIANLGKRYALSHQHRPDSLKTWMRSAFARTGKRQSITAESEEFWALRGISLNVRRGECLALVGGNGSGKSTLLKVLSRIIPPTEGRIRVRGKVASLLEVGTGFHPELTGRENIYLNGAMLGCTAAEIGARFDSIVDFSGIARFLDTPVKHYSSGMYVRLAYSVAAHVNADVLVIDEVLAVGDAEFQAKCFSHVASLLDETTVIFVSHSPIIVERLATHVARLNQGQLTDYGPAPMTSAP